MAYDAILSSEIEVGDAITQSLMQKIADNDEYLFGQLGGISGSGIVPNGSFDIDSDADGDNPDSWSITDYAGGSHTLSATDAAHGALCLKFVHPSGAGNGGGYADSDFMPCNELQPFFVRFLHKCSQSGVKVQAVIRYFSEAQVDLSADETIYSETTNPTSWTLITTSMATPPATAQYFKIRLIGGYTDTNPASSTNIFFDGVELCFYGWAKERPQTDMDPEGDVDFNDFDTTKEIMFVFNNLGNTTENDYLYFSDDNQSTTETIYGESASATRVTITDGNEYGVVILRRVPDKDWTLVDVYGYGTNPSFFTESYFIPAAINSISVQLGGVGTHNTGATVDIYQRNVAA